MKEKDQLFARYSRQIFIEEVGIEGQRKIVAAKVLVVGAGGLGSPVISFLAAAGVGRLGIADFDQVELHNLNRQTIHKESSVGKLKVDSAEQFVEDLNSTIQLEKIAKKITKENIVEILKPYDVIIDGSDNFSTRYLVNDTCVDQQKTLIYGSIFAFEGQVAVFNYQGSKDLRAIFPDAPAPDEVPNCDKNGVLGPLPGIVGSMMAMLALKVICDLPVETNQLTIIDTWGWRFTNISF